MKEYEVIGHATVVCSMHVKANDKTEAIKKANEEFGALTNYVGMGGTVQAKESYRGQRSTVLSAVAPRK